MSNVISFDKYKKEQEIESEFVALLDKEVSVAGNVQPLSNSLLNRMFALKAAADTARMKKEDLLEG